MRGLLLASLLALFLATTALASPQARLVVVVREHARGGPVGSAELSLLLVIDGRTTRINATTNSIGVYVGELPSVPREAYLAGVALTPANISGFLTPQPLVLVRVGDTLLEEVDYEAQFDPHLNVTEVWGLNIPLRIEEVGNTTTLRCVLWVAPGRLVNVSALDPLTRRRAKLTVKPGAAVVGGVADYWIAYLLPLNYPVLLRAATPIRGANELRYWVGNETEVLPWTYYAAEAFVESQLSIVEDMVRQLEAIGYPAGDIKADADALRAVAQQALFLFKRGNYSSAVGAAVSLLSGAARLRRRVEGLMQYSQLTALGILILTLSFSHLVSILVFERGRRLHVLRFSLLLLLLLVMTLTSPTFRLASAGLLGALGVPLAALDVPTLVAGVEVMGFMAYGALILLSLAAGPIRGFWLYLAVKYMKSRRFRTLLILSTMTLVVGSTLAISSLAAGLTPVVREERGIGLWGLDVEVDLIKRPMGLSEIEVEWIKALVGAEEVGREAVIPPVYSGIMLSRRESQLPTMMYLVALDMEFAAKYFNLSAHVYEGRLPRDGALEALLPKGFAGQILVGEKLWLFYARPGQQGPPVPVAPVLDKPVKVVGYFDPYSLNSTLDPECRPLFKGLHRLSFTIIVPYDPVGKYLATARVWLITRNVTAVKSAANLVIAALPVSLHVLEGKRVVTQERVMRLSFRGTEALVLLVLAALMNAVVMFGHVEDRRRDVYTLAVLGADPKNLFNALMTEAIVVGLVSSYAGWLIAPLISYAMSALAAWMGVGAVALSPLPVESLFYAAAVGLGVSLASAYVPSRRVSGLSLMGREEKKVISPSDLRLVGGMAVYELPVRVSVFESETLYRYLKEILPKKDIVGEEVYLDGTFAISFAILPPHLRGTLVMCRLRTVKKGDSLILTLEVPEEYRSYMYLSDVIYALESKLLDYSKWRERQFRYQILRRAPRREVLTLDGLLERCREVMARVREVELKLRRLDEMKATISASLYSEYERKYRRSLNSMIRELLTLSLRLEPFVGQLREEIRRLEAELERHRVARELGEVSEEEYRRAVEPLERQLEEYRRKLRMIEEVNEFLASRRR